VFKHPTLCYLRPLSAYGHTLIIRFRRPFPTSRIELPSKRVRLFPPRIRDSQGKSSIRLMGNADQGRGTAWWLWHPRQPQVCAEIKIPPERILISVLFGRGEIASAHNRGRNLIIHDNLERANYDYRISKRLRTPALILPHRRSIDWRDPLAMK
jgi:hypothetical protein